MHYYYFNLNGGVVNLPEATAEQFMQKIAPAWNTIDTEWGSLHYGEYDWLGEVVDGEYKMFPPLLKDGTRVRSNKTALSFFKLEILGECFLLPDKDQRGNILDVITKRNLKYSF